MKQLFTVAAIAVLTVCVSQPASAAVVRYTQYLDGGASVIVDNASGWSQSEVWNLVLAADRSTRTDCPYSMAAKGLFKTGDRIFVNQNYIAWFDFTRGDGVNFPNPPYSNSFPRSGELAGFWSLDPSTHLFRYYRTGPNGCFNWPPNELIAGSASPNANTNWWDAHSPGFEHAIGVRRTDGLASMYLSFNYSQAAPNSGFLRLLDGYEDGAGVHYKQKARLADGALATDVNDGSDAALSSAYINAEMEYICRTNDILSIFRISPTVNITRNNLVIGLWVAYGQDEDGLQTSDVPSYPCDAGGAGEQWPSNSEVTKRPRYAQFSQTATQNWTGTSFSAHTFIPHTMGTACPNNASYINSDIYTGAPSIGAFGRIGYHSTINISEPRWQMLLLGQPGSGSGTQTNPINLAVGGFIMGNEVRDGTIGLGMINYGNDDTLLANTWYQSYVSIQTNF